MTDDTYQREVVYAQAERDDYEDGSTDDGFRPGFCEEHQTTHDC